MFDDEVQSAIDSTFAQMKSHFAAVDHDGLLEDEQLRTNSKRYTKTGKNKVENTLVESHYRVLSKRLEDKNRSEKEAEERLMEMQNASYVIESESECWKFDYRKKDKDGNDIILPVSIKYFPMDIFLYLATIKEKKVAHDVFLL